MADAPPTPDLEPQPIAMPSGVVSCGCCGPPSVYARPYGWPPGRSGEPPCAMSMVGPRRAIRKGAIEGRLARARSTQRGLARERFDLLALAIWGEREMTRGMSSSSVLTSMRQPSLVQALRVRGIDRTSVTSAHLAWAVKWRRGTETEPSAGADRGRTASPPRPLALAPIARAVLSFWTGQKALTSGRLDRRTNVWHK